MQTHEPAWRSAEDIAGTDLYFKSLAGSSTNVAVSVQALFGRCCLVELSESRDIPEDLAAYADTLVRSILAHPEANQLSLDPLLLIEIYSSLERIGAPVPSLRPLLDRITAELAKQPPEARSIGRVRYIASQLARLGFRMEAARPSKETSALLKSPDSWFALPLATLGDLADHLMADHRTLDEVPARILSLIALAELRNYRVDVACKLLRAALHLGPTFAEAEECLNFVALQRRRNGYYGFSNQMAESGEPAADRHLSLYLPVTLNAVWLFKTVAAGARRERSSLCVGGAA